MHRITTSVLAPLLATSVVLTAASLVIAAPPKLPSGVYWRCSGADGPPA